MFELIHFTFHAPDFYNLFHTFFDILVPLYDTMVHYELDKHHVNFIICHSPIVTYSMPWFDRTLSETDPLACKSDSHDFRGYQASAYFTGLVNPNDYQVRIIDFNLHFLPTILKICAM